MFRQLRLPSLRVCLLIAILACGYAANLAAQAPPVPAPWLAVDVGGPSPAGTSSLVQGVLTVNVGGKGIAGNNDQFRFVYQQVAGDVAVTARVDSIANADPMSSTGVMIRSSLAANAAHGSALASSGSGLYFQRRLKSSGKSSRTYGAATASPQWLKAVRIGSTVTAYSSVDGTTWTTMGSATLPLGSTAYVGVATTSDLAGVATTAQLSNATVAPLSLPSPQQGQDIGSPAIGGSVQYVLGSYTITAAGSGIGANSDQFYYVYQPLQGDVDVIARVASLSGSTAKVGVMVSETLGGASRFASAFMTAGQGYAFDRRLDTTGTVHTAGQAGAAPGWIRLVRSGSQFQAFSSTDGQTWTLIGTDTVPFVLSSVYVGIAVTSSNATATSTAVVDNLTIIQPNQAPNQPPSVTLTAPSNGATYTAPASMTVSANASDPEGQLTKVEFYSGASLIGTATASPYSMTWSSVPAGSYSVTAVAYDAAGNKTTSSAAGVTVSAPVNQPPTVTLTSPASGATYTAPASMTVSANASDPEGQLTKVEFYSGASLIGTATASPYSMTWSSVAAGSYSVTAVAYDGAGNKTTSSAANVTVSTASNQNPTVSLATPVNGATFTAPASIVLNANASDPESRMARVEFYSGATLLATDTASPYSFTWNSVAAGTYSITAKAFDLDGGSATSAAVTITVNANQPPTASVTSPSTGATFTAPASITITASASDPEGQLTKVEFYSGATLIGTATASPYTMTWSSVAAGTYSLTAKAYDAAGNTKTSTAVSVTVSAAGPTNAVFTASTDHATLVTSYRLDVFASGANPNTATPIATSDLGKPTPDGTNTITVNRATFFSSLAPGSYVATVSAIGSGGQSRSASSTFTR